MRWNFTSGPVGVEAVKHFRVDRVRRAQALLVVRVAALGRELLVLRAVEIGKGPCHHVAVLELRRISQGLEEPPRTISNPPRRWPAGGLDTPDHIAQPVERFASALATTSTSSVCSAVSEAWQADDQQAVLRRLRRFGQGLGKGELRLERASGQVALVVELARVGTHSSIRIRQGP